MKWEGYDDDGDVMLTFKTSSVTRGMYLVVTPSILLPGLADIRAGGCDLVIIMAQTWPVQRHWATGATPGPQSDESFYKLCRNTVC